jgi:putative ABC transport system ATP-binding protein
MRARIRKEHVGFVFQKLNLIDHLTCAENVRLGRVLSSDVVSTVLDKVGLKSRQHELSVKLSLGEQQRVAIARVLASKPSVILADEPTSSLDSRNAEIVMDALFEAAGPNCTLVVVSHDERLRRRFAKSFRFEELVHA